MADDAQRDCSLKERKKEGRKEGRAADLAVQGKVHGKLIAAWTRELIPMALLQLQLYRIAMELEERCKERSMGI